MLIFVFEHIVSMCLSFVDFTCLRVVQKIVQSCFFLLYFVFMCSKSLCLFLLFVFVFWCCVLLLFLIVFDGFTLFSLFFCVYSVVVLSCLEAFSLRELFCFSKLFVDRRFRLF